MSKLPHALRAISLSACIACCLTACGGGDGLPCGGAGSLNVDVTYRVNGFPVDPTRTVVLNRNQAVTATPVVVNLPVACATEVNWTYSPGRLVPPGLSFDPATGTLSGIPISLAAFDVELKLEVNGYPGQQVRRTISFIM